MNWLKKQINMETETDKIYNELKKKYTDSEIVESFILPMDKSKEDEVEFDEYLKSQRKSVYGGVKGGMGWPGYDNGEFPQWAIDIIMYRNKKFNEELMELCYNTGNSYQTCSLSLERKYEHIDKSLNEMIQYIERNIHQ